MDRSFRAAWRKSTIWVRTGPWEGRHPFSIFNVARRVPADARSRRRMETLKVATSFGQETINMAIPILAEEIAAFETKK